MADFVRGMLIEYAVAVPALSLSFQFNPQTLTRTRTVTLPASSGAGVRGGYDFVTPLDTPRASLGATLQPETFSVDVLFDGTERRDLSLGIEPELDVLRTMLEPKTQGPAGIRTLANLGGGTGAAFQRQESVSIILFVWGTHVLPTFLTSVEVEETQHLRNLVPVRATATISMQVIEGMNPFYMAEKLRQIAGAALYAPLLASGGGLS